ncbi:S24 family peptidase [Salinibacter altiplanensis]|uniref:S24 family peptidase n=1 Tax=Salinibacter altiplanensis TaxID=1803181 RepID=UPI0012FFD9A8|nr:S24 family peptidase [Salinibacter altiplanensis]
MAEELDRSRNSINSALRKLKDAEELAQPAYGLYDLPERVEKEKVNQMEDVELPLGQDEEDPTGGSGNRSVQIPLYSLQASAGTGEPALKEEVRDYISYDRRQLRREVGADPDDLAVLTVQGISMKPTLTPGDRILVVRHNGGALKDGSIYVLRNPASGVIVKRLFWETETAARLEGDNSRVPQNEIKADDDGHIEGWEVLGQVVRVQQHL